MRKLLNIGGGSKDIPLPEEYADCRHDLLDIALADDVDILCDARQLAEHICCASYDVVYCSHNLEHYYEHEVPRVLYGIKYVLKPGGVVHIVVPNIGQLICMMVEGHIDLEDVLYECAAGPIRPLDVLYGWGKEIEESGEPFYAHKTGFTAKRLHGILAAAGFQDVKVSADLENLQLIALGKSAGGKSVLSPVTKTSGGLYLPDSCAVRGV